MLIQPINEEYREEVNRILKNEWAAPIVITKGNKIDTSILPGFLFIENDIVKGVITFQILEKQCEIVTLNSLEENKGIGTILINAVIETSRKKNCERVFLITTNDNTDAIRFYQRKGFDLAAVHINAMEVSRKLKPSIPMLGMNNIPIKHELEFEIAAV
jgi:Acetyltransferases